LTHGTAVCESRVTQVAKSPREASPPWVLATAAVTVLSLALLLAVVLPTIWYPSTGLLYKHPQYWLDYEYGFVRRGLPGQLLSWAAGGPPSVQQVTVAGRVLTLVACLAVLLLSIRASTQAPTARNAALVLLLLLSSPMTLALLLWDVARFDGIGVVALAALARLRVDTRLPAPTVLVLISALVALSCAAEEFLLLLLAPAAVLRTTVTPAVQALAPMKRVLVSAAVLAPALPVTIASALPPPAASVATARLRARAAGLPTSPVGDALDPLTRTLQENLVLYNGTAATAPGILLWLGYCICCHCEYFAAPVGPRVGTVRSPAHDVPWSDCHSSLRCWHRLPSLVVSRVHGARCLPCR
jgi:hypothetical protein